MWAYWKFLKKSFWAIRRMRLRVEWGLPLSWGTTILGMYLGARLPTCNSLSGPKYRSRVFWVATDDGLP